MAAFLRKKFANDASSRQVQQTSPQDTQQSPTVPPLFARFASSANNNGHLSPASTSTFSVSGPMPLAPSNSRRAGSGRKPDLGDRVTTLRDVYEKQNEPGRTGRPTQARQQQGNANVSPPPPQDRLSLHGSSNNLHVLSSVDLPGPAPRDHSSLNPVTESEPTSPLPRGVSLREFY
jgi:hypothetical protein